MVFKKRGIFLVVLLVIFIFLFSFSVSAACYIYPKGDEALFCNPTVSEEQAKADCEANAGCVFNNVFSPTSNCNEYANDICKQVTCSTDCAQHKQGYCTEELGGTALSTSEALQQCRLGCCIIDSRDSCSLRNNLAACENFGDFFDLSEEWVNFDTSITDLNECRAECGLGPIIEDEEAEMIGTATITGSVTCGTSACAGYPRVTLVKLSQSIVTSTDDRTYSLIISNRPAGTYTLKASLSGYADDIEIITLPAGDSSIPNVNFQLSLPTFQGVTGTVYLDKDGDRNADPDEKRSGANIYIDGIFKGRSSI